MLIRGSSIQLLAFTLLSGLAGAVQAQQSGSTKEKDFAYEASSSEFRLPIEVEPIADGLYTFRWGAARSLFMVTDEGVIVTDPLNRKSAKALRESIAKITDQPVKYVVYSHSHLDRAAGAGIFKDEGARIVAQERCLENMKVTPYPEVISPDITFSDRYSIELGGRSLELFYFGPSHDNCLIVMWPRPASAIYLVNLVQPPSGWVQPWSPMGGDFYFYNIVNYLRSVEELIRTERIESVIGGWIAIGLDAEGRKFLQPPIGPASAVSEAREFWARLMAEVKAEVDQETVVPLVPGRIDRSFYEKRLDRYDEKNFKMLVYRIAMYYTIGW
jgi:hypothetical protein